MASTAQHSEEEALLLAEAQVEIITKSQSKPDFNTDDEEVEANKSKREENVSKCGIREKSEGNEEDKEMEFEREEDDDDEANEQVGEDRGNDQEGGEEEDKEVVVENLGEEGGDNKVKAEGLDEEEAMKNTGCLEEKERGSEQGEEKEDELDILPDLPVVVEPDVHVAPIDMSLLRTYSDRNASRIWRRTGSLRNVERSPSGNEQPQHEQVVLDTSSLQGGSASFTRLPSFEDGFKRTGNVWTASAHILTTVIESGVLSRANSIAQLGWIFGPITMLLFSLVVSYTTHLLADCYRSGNPVTGTRNRTYTDAVRSYLGGTKAKICAGVQFLSLYAFLIQSTIEASVSMTAVAWVNCIHKKGEKNEDQCLFSTNRYIIVFGTIELLLCQIPDLDQISGLSMVGTMMAIIFSTIAIILGFIKISENNWISGGSVKGALSFSGYNRLQKVSFIYTALGNIAIGYSYSAIAIEIQDTIKTPPSEKKTMKKANLMNFVVTTSIFMLSGCVGYAAFGDEAPDNLITNYGYHPKYWLLDIANIAIVVNVLLSYQVYSQPIFAIIENFAEQKWPNNEFLKREIRVKFINYKGFHFKINLFRLIWRSAFVVITTLIPLLLPFVYDMLPICAAITFWPLTVYFPIEMYIVQKRILKWSTKWIWLNIIRVFFLVISSAYAIVWIYYVVKDFAVYRYYFPFTSYW